MAPPTLFNTLEECFDALKQYEIATTSRFVAIASTKSFGLTEIDSTGRKNILWSGLDPYICLGKKDLHCHHGKDKHRKDKEKYKEEKNRKATDHRYARQGRLRIQPTKKLGCPAKVTIREVLVFPDVKIGDGSKRNRALVASTIRSAGITNGKKMFMMTLAEKDEHTNHPIGEFGGLSQRIDASIVGHIHQLLDDGVSRPEEVQRHLQTHVKTAGLQLVRDTNRRFHPTRRTILSHMACHEKKLLKSPDDQDNLTDLLHQWSGEHPDDFVFVRKKRSEANGDSEKFLLVYQSAWMRKLLCLYGNQITMLDATYRTCRFALPLFFLAVRTNVDHQVVGVFIVEDETKSSINEALDIIATQNPLWKPSFYMTDFDEREIGAMEQLFPEAKGILCDFHVMQAWKRWVNTKKHGVQEEAATLAALRELRTAASIEEFDSSLTELKASSLWCPISSYLEKVWLPQKKKWAQCYRSGEIPVGIHTNNGIEGLNSSLKNNYLYGKTVMTLTQMVGTVVKKFLPDKHKRYIEENVKMTGTLKTYHENVPEFLRQRPLAFIEHCIKRIELSKDCKWDKTPECLLGRSHYHLRLRLDNICVID